MKPLLLLAFLIQLTSQQCGSDKHRIKDDDKLYNHWVHSYEEDKAGIKVYRPSEFDFPPARGRESIKIFSNGKFIEHTIAPADGYIEREGKWEFKSDSLIDVYFNSSQPEYGLKIVTLEASLLKVNHQVYKK